MALTKASSTVLGGFQDHFKYLGDSGLTVTIAGGPFSAGLSINAIIEDTDLVLPDDSITSVYINYDSTPIITTGDTVNVLLLHTITTSSGSVVSVEDQRTPATQRKTAIEGNRVRWGGSFSTNYESDTVHNISHASTPSENNIIALIWGTSVGTESLTSLDLDSQGPFSTTPVYDSGVYNTDDFSNIRTRLWAVRESDGWTPEAQDWVFTWSGPMYVTYAVTYIYEGNQQNPKENMIRDKGDSGVLTAPDGMGFWEWSPTFLSDANPKDLILGCAAKSLTAVSGSLIESTATPSGTTASYDQGDITSGPLVEQIILDTNSLVDLSTISYDISGNEPHDLVYHFVVFRPDYA